MDFDSSMKISASGLSANRTWINVLSANLANMNTTRTADGKPYQRRTVIYESTPAENFDSQLNSAMQDSLQKVTVTDIVSDGRDFREVYDPSHPDANENGIVLMPNISSIEEMANLVTASRSYEANLSALNMAKQLAMKALEIGK
ncbi:MAG: flagellar basal body rod protein FlgC [Desulfobacteraceae bacterium]|nr:flagellar basal body rod protein FlgC [Desulfobacteraceae bacterium]